MLNKSETKQYTILVVDDEELIRQILRDQLEESGFSVVTACDGNDALKCSTLR